MCLKTCECFQKEVADINQVTSLIASAKDNLSVYEQPDKDPPSVSDIVDCLEENNQFQGIKINCSLRDQALFAIIKRKFLLNLTYVFLLMISPS